MSLVGLLGLLGLMAAPLAVQAQAGEAGGARRNVLAKQVSVGRSEAALRVEIAGGGELEIAFDEGSIELDGERIGSFEPGDALDSAWRGLLAQAVALDGANLSEALVAWTPPAELSEPLAASAAQIDRALEERLTAPAAEDAERPSVTVTGDGDSALLRLLLGGELGALNEALQGLGPDVQVHVEEPVVVPAGTVVEGTLVAIDSDVSIEGEVEGDVVVVDGTVELLEGSRVGGEVRIADARLLRNQGTVEGGVVDVLRDQRGRLEEVRSHLRDSLMDEVRAELREDMRDDIRDAMSDHDGFSLMAPFRSAARGIGGLIEKIFTVIVLGLIGAAVVAFWGENVEVVADTARRSPGRSALVGLAGSFLLIPAWILGAVALAVSIIGIPVAIAWLPLFPIAACAAALLGYLAVARNAGEWLADSHYPWTDWIRKTNPVHTIFAGLIGLMLAFMAAHVISIVPFLGALAGLLVFVGSLLTFVALQIGFGAVLLTRAGRRREYSGAYASDAAWEAAMDVDVDLDPRPAPEEPGRGTVDPRPSGKRRGTATDRPPRSRPAERDRGTGTSPEAQGGPPPAGGTSEATSAGGEAQHGSSDAPEAERAGPQTQPEAQQRPADAERTDDDPDREDERGA